MKEKVYLAAVRLYNCQSHKDTIYKFSPDKVNVIFGDNGVGKSVFYKMLKASLNPKSLSEKDRIDLIRRKTEYAQIQYLFSDNSNAACRIYVKGVVFQYQDSPNAQPVVTHLPHEKFLEKLNVLMDEQSGFVTNIIDGDNDRLLVNSNLKSNYYFLKLIANNEDIEKLMEKIPLKMGEAQKLKEKLNNKLNYINQRLDVINYVDEEALKFKVNMMEKCNQILYTGIDVYKYLQNLEMIFTEKKDFSYLLQKAEVIQKVLDIYEVLYRVNIVEQFKSESLELCESAASVLEIVELLEKIELPDKDKVLLNQKTIKLFTILQQLKAIEIPETFKDNSQIIDETSLLCEILGRLSQIKSIPANKYDTQKQLADEVSMVLEITEKIKSLQNNLKQVKVSKKEYQEALKAIKESNAIVHCPVYGEVVFDEHNCTPV